MSRILLLGAAVALAGGLMIGQASAAGAGAPQVNLAKAAAAAGSVVEKASYRCWRWRKKCAWRWGDTPRFHRCMWRHGC
jgi:hypothetical protein